MFGNVLESIVCSCESSTNAFLEKTKYAPACNAIASSRVISFASFKASAFIALKLTVAPSDNLVTVACVFGRLSRTNASILPALSAPTSFLTVTSGVQLSGLSKLSVATTLKPPVELNLFVTKSVDVNHANVLPPTINAARASVATKSFLSLLF